MAATLVKVNRIKDRWKLRDTPTRELLAEVGMGYPTAKSHKLLGPRPAAQRDHERREAEKAAKESDHC
jgi:hypothetical protein